MMKMKYLPGAVILHHVGNAWLDDKWLKMIDTNLSYPIVATEPKNESALIRCEVVVNGESGLVYIPKRVYRLIATIPVLESVALEPHRCVD